MIEDIKSRLNAAFYNKYGNFFRLREGETGLIHINWIDGPTKEQLSFVLTAQQLRKTVRSRTYTREFLDEFAPTSASIPVRDPLYLHSKQSTPVFWGFSPASYTLAVDHDVSHIEGEPTPPILVSGRLATIHLRLPSGATWDFTKQGLEYEMNLIGSMSIDDALEKDDDGSIKWDYRGLASPTELVIELIKNRKMYHDFQSFDESQLMEAIYRSGEYPLKRMKVNAGLAREIRRFMPDKRIRTLVINPGFGEIFANMPELTHAYTHEVNRDMRSIFHLYSKRLGLSMRDDGMFHLNTPREVPVKNLTQNLYGCVIFIPDDYSSWSKIREDTNFIFENMLEDGGVLIAVSPVPPSVHSADLKKSEPIDTKSDVSKKMVQCKVYQARRKQ